jgi:hypothetical protein
LLIGLLAVKRKLQEGIANRPQVVNLDAIPARNITAHEQLTKVEGPIVDSNSPGPRGRVGDRQQNP